MGFDTSCRVYGQLRHAPAAAVRPQAPRFEQLDVAESRGHYPVRQRPRRALIEAV